MATKEKSETTRKMRRVFIASPGDLAEERKLFPEILNHLNHIKAHEMGVELEALGWEDTLPGMGRPQALINEDVKECDLFVMLLWKRWGTPPGKNSKYTSGTEEEYELARSLNATNGKPEIHLYFRDVPEVMLADPGEQLRQVLDFRKRVEEERALFFKSYGTVKKWRELLMKYIAGWLDGQKPAPAAPPEPLPPEAEKQIRELKEELGKIKKERQDAQSKLREVAVGFAEQGRKAADQGRLTEAEELFAKSTQTYPEPWAVNAFGLWLMRVGNNDRAMEKFKQVEEIAQTEGRKDYLSVAYGNLGNIYQTRGELKTAEEMHRKALALDEELGSKDGMAIEYGNLGLIYQTRGELKSAEDMHRKALALNEELGRKGSMATQYGNLGLIYQTRGDMDGAEEMHRKALAIDEELERKEGMASDYGNLGLIYQARGDPKAAEEMHRKALALDEGLGRKGGMANQYGNLGLIYQTRGDLKTAEEMFRKSLALGKELGRKESMAKDYGNLGIIYKTRGDLKTAEEMHHKALALDTELGDKEGMASDYGNLGNIYQARGDLKTTGEMFHKSLALFEDVGAQPQVEKVKGLLRKLREKGGE